MSDLTASEKRKLERLFGMSSSYVLDFSDRTFGEFVDEAVNKDIGEEKYRVSGNSKANRLRSFWRIEPNHVAAKLIRALLDYMQEDLALDEEHSRLVGEATLVVARLLAGGSVEALDAIAAPAGREDF